MSAGGAKTKIKVLPALQRFGGFKAEEMPVYANCETFCICRPLAELFPFKVFIFAKT